MTTTDPASSPASAGELAPLTPRDVAALNAQFDKQPPEVILAWAWERFGQRAAIGTSFQGSGLVIMHLAKMAGLNFPIFTLDTGLLFPETLELHKRLEDFFAWKIESIVPDLTVEQQADVIGPDLWASDPDLCCTTRKVLPLQAKLRGVDCWITGLRRHQSRSRADIGLIELYTLDSRDGGDMSEVEPDGQLAARGDLAHIRQHQIPYNPLHDAGYRSIGCHTCTRKTARGEDERAGRWIGFKKVECGIHTFMPRKVDFQI